MHTVNRVAAPTLHYSLNATGNTAAPQIHTAEPNSAAVLNMPALNPTWSTPYVQPEIFGSQMPAFHAQHLINGIHLAPRSQIPLASATFAFQTQQDDQNTRVVFTPQPGTHPHGQHTASANGHTSQLFGMPVRGYVEPQYTNFGFRYGYIGVQPDPVVHAPAIVATPPVAPATPFPNAIPPEISPTVLASLDTRDPLVVGMDTQARTTGPSSNAVTEGLGRAETGGAGMNVNSLLPGNPDVHISTPVQPTAANATGRGRQPQMHARNAGRGNGARGSTGRGAGARGNAGRGSGARGNAERGVAGRGTGARGNGGRGNAGRGAGGSAHEGGTHGGTGNGDRRYVSNANRGTANQPVHRPRIRRRRVDLVSNTARNGTGEAGEGASDEDDDDNDDDDDDDSGDGWNDDDEYYLANSLYALDEDEADDRDWVRGTRTDNEVPIADWNRLGVDDTPEAKREMCMGILYGLSKATLKKCRGWANEYKRFMAHELPKLEVGRFGEEAALKNKNPDEIGAALGQNMGGSWKRAKGDEQWFHGPETNPWRLHNYMTFLANETVAQADRMATLKR
ncbi:unnamed protein product [Closterium sp. NIES-54]